MLYPVLLFLLFAEEARAQHKGASTLAFSPQLTVEATISDVIASLPLEAPDHLRNFRGLVVEEEIREAHYPLLQTVFFDAGQDVPPKRYELFQKPEDCARFSDTTIPGGTIQKYQHLLNIVGYRMRQHPNTEILLGGGYSLEPGESHMLAGRRVMFVRDYLINIWRIHPDRIGILPVYEPLNTEPTDRRDTARQAELRQVAIHSNDWEIVRPLHIRDYQTFVSPSVFHFRIDPFMTPQKIAGCRIEVYRSNRFLCAYHFPWHTDSSVYGGSIETEQLGCMQDIDNHDQNASLRFRAVLTSTDAHEIISNQVVIPSKRFINTLSDRYFCFGKHVDRYTIINFSYRKTQLNIFHKRILARWVVPSITDGSRIKVTGYSDHSESDTSLQLSTARGEGVTRQLLSLVEGNRETEITTEGVGSTQPLFSNDIPEGRCYNRTVQIVIQSPTEQREWWN